jgi:hypothetical protein
MRGPGPQSWPLVALAEHLDLDSDGEDISVEQMRRQGPVVGRPAARAATPPADAADDGVDLDDCCWICLSGEGELARPCVCPRYTHRACLARWQLVSAGKK